MTLQCPGTSGAKIMPVKPRFYILGSLTLSPHSWVKLWVFGGRFWVHMGDRITSLLNCCNCYTYDFWLAHWEEKWLYVMATFSHDKFFLLGHRWSWQFGWSELKRWTFSAAECASQSVKREFVIAIETGLLACGASLGSAEFIRCFHVHPFQLAQEFFLP